MTSLPSPLAAALAALPPGRLGVAVSGGSDSLALLLALHASGRPLRAVTVDHGLRPDSAAEAAAVAALSAARGIPHETLRWTGHPATGNLQANARAGRRGLIAGWAVRHGLAAVALAHTLDDQAETFLLRLARGSGVDGLAAMAPATTAEGVLWLRPFLTLRRAALRDWLAGQGVPWAEDPSNADPRFGRVRARGALPLLAPLGLGPDRLAATAARMARVRAALEAATAALARAALADGGAGDLLLDPAAARAAPEEIRLRLLAGALAWTAGAPYPPRLASLEAALAALDRPLRGGLTLHGCVLRPRGERIAIRREPARAAPPVPAGTRRWDGRWLLETPPPEPGLTIAALGPAGFAGLSPRPAHLAREVLLTTPALWHGARLVAAPFARPDPGVRFRRFSAVTPAWVADMLR